MIIGGYYNLWSFHSGVLKRTDKKTVFFLKNPSPFRIYLVKTMRKISEMMEKWYGKCALFNKKSEFMEFLKEAVC